MCISYDYLALKVVPNLPIYSDVNNKFSFNLFFDLYHYSCHALLLTFVQR